MLLFTIVELYSSIVAEMGSSGANKYILDKLCADELHALVVGKVFRNITNVNFSPSNIQGASCHL